MKCATGSQGVGMNTGAADDREGFAAFLLRLRGKGWRLAGLIAAFEATPRRAFLPGQWQNGAWSERMIPIECGEAMEGVDLQARIIAALALEPGHRVLEIGTGSGFTAAVMSPACRPRRHGRALQDARPNRRGSASRRWASPMSSSAKPTVGNGLPGEGPFDRIVVWAAFDGLPRAFVDQLSTGGIMIAPIGPEEGEQVLARLTKVGSRFEREDIARAPPADREGRCRRFLRRPGLSRNDLAQITAKFDVYIPRFNRP